MGIFFEIHTFILGLVQGICEFLPVSSSGHLALFQQFFGLTASDDVELLAFDLLLHCATVIVILIFFRNDIFRIIRDWFSGWFISDKRSSWGWSYGWQIIIATFMTGIFGLPLKNIVENMSVSSLSVGFGLIFTGVIMSFLPVFSGGRSKKSKKNFSPLIISIAVGIAQGLAVLPGVSRSGMTIATGMLMGLTLPEAFKFSFLISVPAVLAASLLEIIKLLKSGEIFLPNGYLCAVLVAFISGYFALNFTKKLVLSGKWAYFGLYCLFVGALAVLLSLEIF